MITKVITGHKWHPLVGEVGECNLTLLGAKHGICQTRRIRADFLQSYALYGVTDVIFNTGHTNSLWMHSEYLGDVSECHRVGNVLLVQRTL